MLQLNLCIAVLLTVASCYAAPASSSDLDPVIQKDAIKSTDDSATREKKSYVAPSGCIEVHGPSHATYSICNSADGVPILPSYAAAPQYGGIPSHFDVPHVPSYSSAPQYGGHASIAIPSTQVISPGFNGGYGSISLPSAQLYTGGRPIYPVNPRPIYRSDEAATTGEFMPKDMATWQQIEAQLAGAGEVQMEGINARSVYGGSGIGGGAVSVFPTLLSGGHGCGAVIPLLLTCNPNVVQGNIASPHGYAGWNNPIGGLTLGGIAPGYQAQLGSPIGYRQNEVNHLGGSSQTAAGALNDRQGSASKSTQNSQAASSQLHKDGNKNRQ